MTYKDNRRALSGKTYLCPLQMLQSLGSEAEATHQTFRIWRRMNTLNFTDGELLEFSQAEILYPKDGAK